MFWSAFGKSSKVSYVLTPRVARVARSALKIAGTSRRVGWYHCKAVKWKKRKYYHLPTRTCSSVASLCLGCLPAALVASRPWSRTVTPPACALWASTTGPAALAPGLPRTPVSVDNWKWHRNIFRFSLHYHQSLFSRGQSMLVGSWSGHGQYIIYNIYVDMLL